MNRNAKSPELYLKDIQESIKIILGYVAGKTAEDFSLDIGLQDKIIRRIEIIGEAAKYVPEELRLKTPQIPWTIITDMRNVLIHEYFGVDLFRIWDVVNGPRLRELNDGVEKLLSEMK
jgi:uncharacterized protein with HEPN domain